MKKWSEANLRAACVELQLRTYADMLGLVRDYRESRSNCGKTFLAVVQTAIRCGVSPERLAECADCWEPMIRELAVADRMPDLSWARSHPDPRKRDLQKRILDALEQLLDVGATRTQAAA